MSTSALPESTRTQILDAAARLFARLGVAVRLEDVAEEAGVSRQTVYLHFGSRTGLLVAMVQHIDATGPLPGLIERVFDAPTAPEALDAVVDLHAEYYPMIYAIAAVFLAGKYEDEALRAAWAERMDSRRNLYHTVVERLESEGFLAPTWEGVEVATDLLWALTSWQLWEQLVIDRKWSKEEYLRHLRSMLRHLLVGERPA